MDFALSTRWNASRHSDGGAMIDEILALGFDRVELGYDLTRDLVPGVLERAQNGAVRVDSVHNFCPVPMGVPKGHPELFLLAAEDARIRDSAVQHTLESVRLAAQIGARHVVVHAGYIATRCRTRDLIDLCMQNKQYSDRYEKMKVKLLLQREKGAAKALDRLSASVETMAEEVRETGVALAFENLPSWEGIPSEPEVETLCRRFGNDLVGYWHDIGHGEVRQHLGFTGHRRWLEILRPWVSGYHVHDVIPPVSDHVMPPEGTVDFRNLRPLLRPGVPLVIESVPGTPEEAVRRGLAYLREVWPGEPFPGEK